MVHNFVIGPVFAKGVGVMIGEWLFAPNGPFLFHRFGLGNPAAVALAVLAGAAVGYVAASAAWSLYHRPTPRHAGYGVTVDHHLGASLRI
jgi:hypothetical protein